MPLATPIEIETSKLNYSDTHREIVLACQNGDQKAQFELYNHYAKAMYNICLRMVKTEADAEDMLQHSFMDVFSKLHTFRFQSSVGAWIKRIVINNCINFLKKKRIQFEEMDEGRAYGIADMMLPEEDTTYDVQRIKKALFQLPDGYRVVFSLYLLEGYDHQEIADILGINVATSKSQYSRAKKKIRTLISNP